MAKATIVSEIGDGQYAVNLDYDTEYLDDIIAGIAQQLIDGEQPLIDAQVELIDLRNARQTSANELDSAIDDYRTAVASDPANADSSAVVQATKALAAAANAVTVQQLKVDRLITRKLSLARRKTFLENLLVANNPASGTLAWCADYSTGATGTVPIALVPGELGSFPWVILPRQHPDAYAATYSREAFGQLVPRMSMTPEATYYNWALLPAWQRWMPTFRIGEIEALDQENDTCNLVLETTRSSANPYPYSNGLNVNLAESTVTRLEGVPIRYMTCDSLAFEIGDRVLVRFKGAMKETSGPGNWGDPEVIGFVSNPRDCGVGVDLLFVLDRSDSQGATTDRFTESGNIVTGLTTLADYLRNGPPSPIVGEDGPVVGVNYWGYYAYASDDPDYDADLVVDLQNSVDTVRSAIITSGIGDNPTDPSYGYDAVIDAVDLAGWREDTADLSRRIVFLITDRHEPDGAHTAAEFAAALSAANASIVAIITIPVDQLGPGSSADAGLQALVDAVNDAGGLAWYEPYAEDFVQIAYYSIKSIIEEA